jgi:branched-chain amino acid transport system ATP-binding protein
LALFPKLSLLENVMIGAHIHLKTGFAEAALGLGRTKRQETQKRDEAFELLEIVGLSKQAGEPVWSQPFGYQKRVELARALATQPKLLLLDEPAAGLNPSELRGFQELISSVRRRFGLTILLVEHHFGLVMALCERLVALNFGRKIAEGSPEEVRADPEFVRAYLGDKV